MKNALKNLRGMCKSSKAIANITKIWFSPVPPNSKWLQPCRMHFLEDGVEKFRDIVKIKDAVLILLYNISRQKLVFVRQFRPAVYHGVTMGNTLKVPEGDVDLEKYPPELGLTLELCAGVVDKKMSLKEVAREEVLEECGYSVDIDSLKLIFNYRSGIGTSSGGLSLFYCEVCDAQKISQGGGVNDEQIEVVELSIEQARQIVKVGSTINGAPGLLVGLLWFLTNKQFSQG